MTGVDMVAILLILAIVIVFFILIYMDIKKYKNNFQEGEVWQLYRCEPWDIHYVKIKQVGKENCLVRGCDENGKQKTKHDQEISFFRLNSLYRRVK